MQLNTYEEGVAQYFGDSPNGKEVAQQILLQLFQKSNDKVLKAKAAYFLGTIHLTHLLQVSLKKPASTKQSVLLSQGLEWLKKSHELGYEEASLLLGKIFSCSGKDQLEKLEIVVEGRQLGKILFYDEYLLDSINAAKYLLPRSKNKEVATILHRFAVQYLVLMDEMILGNGKRLVEKFSKSALKPMFTDPIDFEFNQQVTNLAKSSKKFVSGTDRSEETPIELLNAAESFANKGAYHAMEMLCNFHSAKTHIVTAGYRGPKPNPEEGKRLAMKLWKRRLVAFKTAISWLDNAKELVCQDSPSAGNMELYRLNIVYIEARIAGMSHEKASEQRNVAVNKAKVESKTAQANSPKVQFFSSGSFETLYQDGLKFINQQQFQSAEIALQQALSELRKLSSTSTVEYADCHLVLAQCLKKLGKYEFALQSCDEAISVFKKHQEFEKIETAVEIYQDSLNISKPPLMQLIDAQSQLLSSQNFYQLKEVSTQLYRRTAIATALSVLKIASDSITPEIARMKQHRQEKILQKEGSDIEKARTELKIKMKALDIEIDKITLDLAAMEKEHKSSQIAHQHDSKEGLDLREQSYLIRTQSYETRLNELLKTQSGLLESSSKLDVEENIHLSKFKAFYQSNRSDQEKMLKGLQETFETLQLQATRGPK